MIQTLIIGTMQAGMLIERLRQEEKETENTIFETENTIRETEESGHEIVVCFPLSKSALTKILKAGALEPKSCFCIAETEEAARASLALGIPCIAYSNPELPGQKFSGIDLLLEGFEEIDWNFLESVHTRALGLPVVIARTKRLLIREMTLEDLDALYELYREPSIRQFVKGLEEDRALEEERTRAYIRYMYGLYQFGMWVLIEKESGTLIGRAGFGIADYRGESELDLGYLIGKPWQGQGLAQEACRAVLAYGKEVLGFEKVASYVHRENLPSIAVVRKLGFTERELIEAEGEQLLCFEKNLKGEKEQ